MRSYDFRIPAEAQGDVWTLAANPPKHREPRASRETLATMLGSHPPTSWIARCGSTPGSSNW